MVGHDFNSWGVETHRGSIPPFRRRVPRRSCTVDEAVRQACIRPGNPGESGWWAVMTSAGEEGARSREAGGRTARSHQCAPEKMNMCGVIHQLTDYFLFDMIL